MRRGQKSNCYAITYEVDGIYPYYTSVRATTAHRAVEKFVEDSLRKADDYRILDVRTCKQADQEDRYQVHRAKRFIR